MRHSAGLRAEVTNYGATLMRLQFPNREGKLQDLILGYDDPKNYLLPPYNQYNYCIGATIGRYAGRISNGGFTLENTFYPLPNDNGVHLHGGGNGFDKQLWSVMEKNDGEKPFIVFALNSPDGAGGYPGNLTVLAKYQLTEDSLLITYEAETDRTTALNLTNHAYFHLDDSGSVLGKDLFINAAHILEVDERLLPTGQLKSVIATPFNYMQSSELHFRDHFGLDTPFALREGKVAASLYSPISGIKMDVETNQPSVVVFTPKSLPKLGLRREAAYRDYPAICFECQNFPDAPNKSNFPSSVLRPGEKYRNEIRYRFSIK